MKFIGDGSHSFDGKIKVNNGDVYYNKDGSRASSGNWQKIKVDDKGLISLESNGNGGTGSEAQLTGGNANSKFYFDHTSVKLGLIKDSGGRTYVYNSTILGEIAVSNRSSSTAKPNTITPSTTLFFNVKMDRNVGDPANSASRDQSSDTQTLTPTAESFITSQFKDVLGINLDLKTAHELKEENLSTPSSGSTDPGNTGPGSTGTATKKLGVTSKQTNIVLIGKKAFNKSTGSSSRGTTGDAIDLSFLPESSHSNNYAYTIISGGVIEASTLENISHD